MENSLNVENENIKRVSDYNLQPMEHPIERFIKQSKAIVIEL